jgi:hypothetical protein
LNARTSCLNEAIDIDLNKLWQNFHTERCYPNVLSWALLHEAMTSEWQQDARRRHSSIHHQGCMSGLLTVLQRKPYHDSATTLMILRFPALNS